MTASEKRSGRRLRGPVYVDASALAKLYLPEAESDSLELALFGRRDLQVSNLAVTEVISAAARRRREGLLTSEQLSRVHSALLDDVSNEGAFLRLDLEPSVHREAERLLVRGATDEGAPGLRAADALHLALAVTAAARTLVTFDQRLAQAARMAGLHVFPALGP